MKTFVGVPSVALWMGVLLFFEIFDGLFFYEFEINCPDPNLPIFPRDFLVISIPKLILVLKLLGNLVEISANLVYQDIDLVTITFSIEKYFNHKISRSRDFHVDWSLVAITPSRYRCHHDVGRYIYIQ